jgi:hypothetical protein
MQEVSELKFRINLLLAMASVSEAEIARKNREISEQAAEIARKNLELSQRAAEIAAKNLRIADLERALLVEAANREAILSSTSWRATAFLRWLGRIRRSAK